MNGFKLFARKKDWSHQIEIAAINRRPDGSIEYFKDVIVESLPLGSAANSFMEIDATQAQQLMDQLWDCGLRPSEGSGSAGSLAATERHLADMRRLVFERTPA